MFICYQGIFIGNNVIGQGFILPAILRLGLELFYFKQHEAWTEISQEHFKEQFLISCPYEYTFLKIELC